MKGNEAEAWLPIPSALPALALSQRGGEGMGSTGSEPRMSSSIPMKQRQKPLLSAEPVREDLLDPSWRVSEGRVGSSALLDKLRY